MAQANEAKAKSKAKGDIGRYRETLGDAAASSSEGTEDPPKLASSTS